MDEYERFKQKVYKKTGVDLSLYKEEQMKRRITSLARRNKFDNLDDYFAEIDVNKEKYDQFINFFTINVSEFFRNPEQWKIVDEMFFKYFIKKKGNVKIWSAACSTGEEPYTMAMLLSRYIPLSRVDITATDIDMGAIEKAKAGVYIEKSIQNVPSDLKAKYFTKDKDGKYLISPKVKSVVKFKQHNLLSDTYMKGYDMIVCRNVMIYFTNEAKDEIYHKFRESLAKDGVLFVGSTEQIIGAQNYGLKTVKTFFYNRDDYAGDYV